MFLSASLFQMSKRSSLQNHNGVSYTCCDVFSADVPSAVATVVLYASHVRDIVTSSASSNYASNSTYTSTAVSGSIN